MSAAIFFALDGRDNGVERRTGRHGRCDHVRSPIGEQERELVIVRIIGCDRSVTTDRVDEGIVTTNGDEVHGPPSAPMSA